MRCTQLLLALIALASGCDDGGGPLPIDPSMIAGGGAAGGPIDGELNVFTIDGLTGLVIAGARVRVGGPADTTPLEGLTNSAGRLSWKDAALKGPVTVTATAAGHAAVTWIGIDATNFTRFNH